MFFSLNLKVAFSVTVMDWLFVFPQIFKLKLNSQCVCYRKGASEEVIKIKRGHKGGALIR